MQRGPEGLAGTTDHEGVDHVLVLHLGRVLSPAVTEKLFGRDTEMAALEGVLATARRGSLTWALVEGEAGIGKSSLVAAAARQARAWGFGVFSGACHQLEHDRPFGAVADALHLQGRTDEADRLPLARLLEGHDGTDTSPLDDHAPGLRFRILEGILAVVEKQAVAGPVAMILEDLHWADRSTLLVIDHLCRRLAHHPIALVVTLRPSPRPPELDRLLERVEPDLRLPLGGLEEEVVAHLTEQLTGTRPGDDLLALLRGARGNPLFLIELVTALGEDGAITPAGGLSRPGRRSLPPSFRLTTLRRFSFLAPPTLRLLRTASVLGQTFAVDDLAAVLGTDATEMLVTLDEALRAGLIGESGDHLAFRHALVADAIYDDLPTSARRALHHQVARRLAQASRPAGQVARHFRLGAQAGDREAIRWLRRAGQTTASRAPEAAVELFESALAIASPDDEQRDALEAELGVALVWSGRLAEGTSKLHSLLERPHDREVHVATCFGLARALLLGARAQECIELLQRCTADPELPARERPRFLAETCLAHLVGAEIAEAKAVATRARQAGEDQGDEAATCLAMNVLAAVHGLEGRLAEGIELAEQSVARAAASPDREASRIPPQFWLAGLLMDADRLDESRRLLEAARCISEEFGTVWDQPVYHLLSAQVHFLAGDYDDALAEAEVGVALGDEVGTLVQVVWAHAIVAHVYLQRGDLGSAERAVVAGEQAMAETGPQVRGTDLLLWVRALLLEANGARDEALSLLRLLWDGLGALGIFSDHILIGPDLVRLLVADDQREAAAGVAAAVDAVAANTQTAAARGAARRCQGLATGDPDLLGEAVDAYAQSCRRMEHARAAEEAGTALARAGRRDEARRFLEQAHALYRQRHARHAQSRTEAGLRRIGVSTGSRGARRRPVTGWAALTESEERVTRLAAEGLTNPEIGSRLYISRRTVESHLGHVFAKLGVSSRVELASLVARREAESAVSRAGGRSPRRAAQPGG